MIYRQNTLATIRRSFYGRLWLIPIWLNPARVKTFYGGLRLKQSTAADGGGFGVYLARTL